MTNYIDTHCHLDFYKPKEQQQIISELKACEVDHIISVSFNLASCKDNQALHAAHPQLIKPAYGFHPEQALPTEAEIAELLQWIRQHSHEAAAIGEVGLPYYTRHEAWQKGTTFELQPYIDLLETFIALAAELHKPLALHTIYEDAEVTCDLLEQYNIKRAHFHWFKGSTTTIQRIINNGYYISFTPDIFYESEIQDIAKKVPLTQMMVETDGPWQFEGPFTGEMTHPLMLASIIGKIAGIKEVSESYARQIIYENSRRFYYSNQ